VVDASTTRLQRFLRASVACLLTANGFALVLLATNDPAPLPAEQGTRTVTLIQGADGKTTQVDPATPAGQAAIEEAKRDGATITETTVATPTTTPGETTTTVQSLLPEKSATTPTLPPVTLPTLPVTIPPVTIPPVTVPTLPVTVPTLPPVTVPTTIKPPSTTIPTIPVTVPTIPVTVPTIPVTVPTVPLTVPTLPHL